MKATGNRFRIANENIEGEFYGNTENSPTKNARNTKNVPEYIGIPGRLRTNEDQCL